MKIIKTKDQKLNFIIGIFDNKEYFDEYYAKIPNEKINQFEILSLPVNFPFYVIEENNDFKFFNTIIEIEEKLKQINLSDNEEEHYFNLYVITDNFQPKNPGEDYMGALKHFHVDYDFFKRYRISEFITLLRKIG